MVKTVVLGKTGLEVSRVGIGGIPILRPSKDEAIEIVRHAFDLGVRFVDTASVYGTSEARIGKAAAGRRDQLVIATKTTGRTKAEALRQLHLSLKRLRTDTIDLWQFHSVGTSEAYEQVLGPGGAMEAAQEALEAGKIRHIGLTSHALDIALKAVPSGHFETVQFPLNFVNNEAADELVGLAKEHDVGFIAMKPFAGGRLNNPSLVVKYLLQFDNVVPIPGIQSREEIEEILAIVGGSWALTQRELQEMERIRSELGAKFCQWCGYCLPCPEDVNIPWVMNARAIAASYTGRYWSTLERAVESAGNCIQCGECEEKCPFQLPIREMIVENVRFYESSEWSL